MLLPQKKLKILSKKPPKSTDKQTSPKKKLNPALKYSGMAVQMAITIFIAIYLGKWVDNYFQTEKPYFVLLFSIVFLAGILYSIIRQVSND